MGRETFDPQRSAIEYPLGFWSVNIETGLATLDAMMSACFGLSEDVGARGVSQHILLDRILPDDHATILSVTCETIRRRGYLSYAYGIRNLDGTVRSVRALGRCFTDESGEPTHIAGILIDAGPAAPLPVHVRVIEHLMAARDLSQAVDDTVLMRLIDAVLLEAGRSLARTTDGPVVDRA